MQIAESQGEADLARARKQAEQTVVMAEAELARARRQAEQTVLTAEAESKKQVLAGRGEGQKAMQIGLSEAAVLLRKAAATATRGCTPCRWSRTSWPHSTQPLVPERVFMAGGERRQEPERDARDAARTCWSRRSPASSWPRATDRPG